MNREIVGDLSAHADDHAVRALVLIKLDYRFQADLVEVQAVADVIVGADRLRIELNDLKLALIEQYAATYENMTDKQASDLAKKSFDLEEKKTDLKRQYFKKFAKVIPAKKAARFFQIDNQLNMALDLQVAAALPLIK